MTNESCYKGYESYSYLEANKDYEVFDLALEKGRVPPFDLSLDSNAQAHVRDLMENELLISLHDHPEVFPADMTQLRDYVRAGRQPTGYLGLSESGLAAVFDNLMDGFSCVTSKNGWKWNDVIYDLGMRLCDLAHQDYARVVHEVADILAARECGQIGVVLCLEAATPIENEVDRIDILYGFGVRQMGIAYSEANTLGSGLKEHSDGGLTVFGKRAIQRMNKLGIAIDVSHSGDRTCLDVFEASSRPVLITHAGARAVWPTARMKPDVVLTACAQSGGVLGIEAAPHTTISRTHSRHSIESVMDHFEYCVDLMGIEHVAFGPDTLFGDHVGLHKNVDLGATNDPKTLPPYETVEYVDGLENPGENFHNIIGWLVKHGYTDEDIRAVVGGNILRVLQRVW